MASSPASRHQQNDVYPPILTDDQIADFERDGILVIDNVFDEEEMRAARVSLDETLGKYGIDREDLGNTASNLRELSSTNGSGGVLDIFYPSWKLKLATDPRLFSLVSQLWKVAYCGKGSDEQERLSPPERNTAGEDASPSEREEWKTSPFGDFNPDRGYAYIDRIGYRIPTAISKQVGSSPTVEPSTSTTSRKRAARPLQRSLTPHLDCCPDSLLQNKESSLSKWRPLQSFISLTDNPLPNTGGFEAVPGFHRSFHSWARSRPPTSLKKKGGITIQIPPPCVGEFTPIRPTEDRHVFERIRHIPCRAGSVVIWDHRIPHANAFRNDGTDIRMVVYASFLPDVELNRRFAREQLKKYEAGIVPTDQWVEKEDGCQEETEEVHFSRLGRNLMGLEDWTD